MKRDTVKRFSRLLFVFGIYLICFGSYFTVQSKEYPIMEDIITEEEPIVVVDRKEEVIEEPISFETPVVQKTENPVLPNVQKEEVKPVVESTPVVSTEVPSNSIQVAGINSILMKDKNGEHFYLNHNLQGVYDGVGVPYIDHRYDFKGIKTIVYAHSIKGGNGPFQVLQNYHNDPSFYWSHPTITIHYENQTYIYQIFSVYVSLADNEESEGLEFFHRDFYTKKDWGKTLQMYKSYSEYDTGVSVDSNDKILILQTCSMDDQYYEKYYRYNLLVMGKLV